LSANHSTFKSPRSAAKITTNRFHIACPFVSTPPQYSGFNNVGAMVAMTRAYD
jgi:hypothetical protein